jgi:hypothetical protein
MALELIVNVLLFVIAIFCYWHVGETMPQSPESELGAEQWPQLLLILLIIALTYNLYKYFKTNKKEDIAAAFADFFPSIARLVKSKLFVGMILLVGMSFLYEPLGFIATCPLFMISYGFLLGARRPLPLVITSLVITAVLYVGFAVFLSIMLPRGYVPFLRDAAFFIEKLFGA